LVVVVDVVVVAHVVFLHLCLGGMPVVFQFRQHTNVVVLGRFDASHCDQIRIVVVETFGSFHSMFQ
jgi:hypothetical protein